MGSLVFLLHDSRHRQQMTLNSDFLNINNDFMLRFIFSVQGLNRYITVIVDAVDSASKYYFDGFIDYRAYSLIG